MTAHVVIACSGEWNGMPCRGAHPVPADESRYPVQAARLRASDAGWVETVDGRDLCPAHARHHAQQTIARLAAEAPKLTRDRAVAALLPNLPAEWHAEIQAPGNRVRIELTDSGLIARTRPDDTVLDHMAAMRAEHEARMGFLADTPGRSPLQVAAAVIGRLTGGPR